MAEASAVGNTSAEVEVAGDSAILPCVESPPHLHTLTLRVNSNRDSIEKIE